MSDTPVFEPNDRVDDIEALLRDIDETDHELLEPPSDVWAGIETELAGEQPTSPPTSTDDSIADVVSITERRSRFTPTFLGVAAAVALLAVGAVVVASIRGGNDAPVIASAQLAYDAEAFDPLGAGASATAELVESDGGYEIRLADTELPDPAENDLELWLIAAQPDGSLDVQSVSLVDADEPGVYAVPADLDPAVHSIVDISIEPRDGDEAHSGRSILRGQLNDI